MLLEKTLRLEKMSRRPHTARRRTRKQQDTIVMPPHLFMKAFTLMRSSTKPLVLKVAADEVVDVDKMNA